MIVRNRQESAMDNLKKSKNVFLVTSKIWASSNNTPNQLYEKTTLQNPSHPQTFKQAGKFLGLKKIGFCQLRNKKSIQIMLNCLQQLSDLIN
jgi:hypothetical protein